MIINNSNKLYVQKIDLLNLINSDTLIPGTIYNRIKKIINNERDNYKFIKFSVPEEIDFLTSIPWIIDYNNIKDVGEDEIIEMINGLEKEKEILLESIKIQTGPEKYDTYVKIQKNRLKMQSLTEFLLYKYGCIKMTIPKKIRKK